jgi:hypothetical protein
MTHAASGLQAFLRAKVTLERLFLDPAISEAIRDAIRDALIDLTPAELRMTAACETPERESAPRDALHVWLARVYNHPDEVLAALDARYMRRKPPTATAAALAACQEKRDSLKTRLQRCSEAATRLAPRLHELEAEREAVHACKHPRIVPSPRLGSGCPDCGSIYDEWPSCGSPEWRKPTLLERPLRSEVVVDFGAPPGKCVHDAPLNVVCGQCDVEDAEPGDVLAPQGSTSILPPTREPQGANR